MCATNSALMVFLILLFELLLHALLIQFITYVLGGITNKTVQVYTFHGQTMWATKIFEMNIVPLVLPSKGKVSTSMLEKGPRRLPEESACCAAIWTE